MGKLNQQLNKQHYFQCSAEEYKFLLDFMHFLILIRKNNIKKLLGNIARKEELSRLEKQEKILIKKEKGLEKLILLVKQFLKKATRIAGI